MLKRTLIISFVFIGSISQASNLAELSLPELKESICEIKSLPDDSQHLNPTLKKSFSLHEDKLYKHNCLMAKSFDKLSYEATQRGNSCAEKCSDGIYGVNGIDSCQKECQNQAKQIILRITYFKKGIDTAESTDCGRKKTISDTSVTSKKKTQSVR